MKFLCVPCDTQMMLKETFRDEANGALSVVFSCAVCGKETAMLTNPGETQLVQSLGVRIGPESSEEESAGKCPFAAMLSGGEESKEDNSTTTLSQSAPAGPLWTAEAEDRLEQVPEFVRPMAKIGIEKYAVARGEREITVDILEQARESFGL